jgi:hypothetical protein
MTETTRLDGVFTRSGVPAEGALRSAVITEITRTDGLVTRDQAAAFCGVGPSTIAVWVTRGQLRVARREGRSPLFRLLDVAKADQMLTPNRHRTTAKPMPVLGADPATILAIARACADDAGAPVRERVVYYLRFADRIKIGSSFSLAGRLQSVPHDELLATEPGGRSLERRRHGQFAAYRITGEWFSAARPLMEHIAAIRLGAEDTPAP